MVAVRLKRRARLARQRGRRHGIIAARRTDGDHVGVRNWAGRGDIVAREWPSRVFRVVVGFWAAAIAALVLGTTATDLASVGLFELVFFVVPFGVLFPLWLVSLYVVVRRRDGDLVVLVWPLLYRARIASTSLLSVEFERGAFGTMVVSCLWRDHLRTESWVSTRTMPSSSPTGPWTSHGER